MPCAQLESEGATDRRARISSVPFLLVMSIHAPLNAVIPRTYGIKMIYALLLPIITYSTLLYSKLTLPAILPS